LDFRKNPNFDYRRPIDSFFNVKGSTKQIFSPMSDFWFLAIKVLQKPFYLLFFSFSSFKQLNFKYSMKKTFNKRQIRQGKIRKKSTGYVCDLTPLFRSI
jgi:hypothetical protein